jgi:simple sugar transport system permease protein
MKEIKSMEKLLSLYSRDKNLSRLLIIFFGVLLICSLTKGSLFFKIGTFQTMGILFPEYGLLALGMALALFSGGIDLSVVYQANMCAIVISKILIAFVKPDASMQQALPIIVFSFIAAVLIGAACGTLNGLLISGVGIPPILATLGTQSVILGLSVVITGGRTVSRLPPQMSQLLNTKPLGIPLSMIVFFVIAIIISFVLSKTKLGYRFRMYGTNAKATVYSGLSNLKLVISNYMIIGVLAAFSGILMTGRLNSAKADNGASYTMQVILIAVLGGINPNGGKGNIPGVVIAIIIVQMISTWLSMLQSVSTFYRQIIWGALLIFVLIFSHINNQLDLKRAKKYHD